MSTHTIIIFYAYVPIDNPAVLRERELSVCRVLGLTGRMIIAEEGVNATLEGTNDTILAYIAHVRRDKRFRNVDIKKSEGRGDAFPRLSIRIRPEIVASNLGKDIDPRKDTGIHLPPRELRKWYERGEDFEIIDMRNSYEYAVGHFKDSHDAGMNHFRELPQVIAKFEGMKEKKVVTVCTAGVRCEKASAYLKAHGFKNVYQLHGGMHRFMEEFPGEDFVGTLYTFDDRVTMDFGRGENPEVVGSCAHCGAKTERYADCKDDMCGVHFLACDACRDEHDRAGCALHR